MTGFGVNLFRFEEEVLQETSGRGPGEVLRRFSESSGGFMCFGGPESVWNGFKGFEQELKGSTRI